MEFIFKTTIWILLELVSRLDFGTSTRDGVLLKDSDYQKITSNTLKWVSPSPSGSIPEDAVIGSIEYIPNDKREGQSKERKIYICRAFFAGIWVPGAVFEHSKGCIVTGMVGIHVAEQYDVLINIDQAGRVVWPEWDHQQEVPRGAVSAGEYFIGHSASPEFHVSGEKGPLGMTFRIGKIDPAEGIFGKMSVVNEKNEIVKDVESGQVLVEYQPVIYELTITNFTRTPREKILVHQTLDLGEKTLRNEDNREMKAEAVITHQWKYESSWGQGRAMSRALETRIQFRNSTYIETVSWGIPHEDAKRECIVKIEKTLPAGTASHVQVTGIYQIKEVPYTGTLLSVFGDNKTMNRTIHEIRKYSEITNITISYGPLYFIQNSSLVPTTTTTTTEAPSTITTTTMLPTAKSGSPIKDDSTNIISDNDDQSDPMQLKNKGGADNGSNILFPQFQLLSSTFIVAFLRFTW